MVGLVLHVFRHKNSLLHSMGSAHLEAPIRVELIQKALQQSKLKTKFREAKPAKEEDILKLHSIQLYNSLRESSKNSETIFTMDTIANSNTYDAALTAAGGAIQLAKDLKSRNHQFGMLRPPGHHATFGTIMGFCFLNNIGLSANTLLDQGFKRIAIIDIDHHHGNGTQDLFYGIPQILYTSLHADPEIAFPGTGFTNEIGFADGIGKTVNVPLPVNTGDTDLLVAFDEVIYPIVDQYKPEAILVSLGLDGLHNDPYGILSYSTNAFKEMGRRIGKLAENHCRDKIGVILEGGYKYSEIGEATVEFFSGLNDHKKLVQNELSPTIRFDDSLRSIKALQRNYWFGI